ncbi:isoamyl alcohol oxidase [Fusarium bulbicola]|nr:isoamyl alcohol oxidase [Fusarium bulbicola]
MRLFALLLCSAGLASSTEPPRCKLSPFDATWPVDAEWAALNSSISGSLIKTRPAASSCYKTNPFDAPLNCNIVEANWTQSTFHANLPESISAPLYANNSCLPPGAPGYNKALGCHLGGYPSYVVNATSDEQIALAVKWASKRNIRLVVKGTGHDLSGRSSGAHSLSIWTRHMQRVEFDPNWIVPGTNKTDTVLIAVSGLTYGDAVGHALKHGHVIVSGNDATVGLGGHIQGGGHGPLSSTFGLAADNIYQVRVVTTQGHILTADATKNQDLLWAIRGGGAGQYGIVTEYVLKAYPAPSVIETGFTISPRELLRVLPDLMDAGLAGAAVVQGNHKAGVSISQGFYAFNKSKTATEELTQMAINKIHAFTGNNSDILSIVASNTTVHPTYKGFFEALNAGGSYDMGSASRFVELAKSLIEHGPRKTMQTSRRIRAVHNHTTIVDTTHGAYVWEHDSFPTIYVPAVDVKNAKLVDKTNISVELKDRAAIAQLVIPTHDGIKEAKVDNVVHFFQDVTLGALSDMVRIEFRSIDQWFEEDEPIFVHAKDPFKRVDILHSTRPIEVKVNGRTVAKATSSMHLLETGLPTRYYLPLSAVDQTVLSKSPVRSKCPYKGEAEYYNIVIDGKTFENLVWYYNHPTLESAAIARLVCFYNEKVDIILDGELQERPKTKFA